MQTNLTIARPYIKAVFALALSAQKLSEWNDVLSILSATAVECKKKHLLNNPQISSKQILAFFCDISKSFPSAMGLIGILEERKKLELLPNIAFGYKKLFLEHKKTLEAKVVSAHELTTSQKNQLMEALQQRYQHQILLKCKIDDNLIGGAVIHINGQIIDGSIKGMLHRLKQSLL